jgi:hypothetical protein
MANTITQWKPTYRELKKNMRLLLKRAADNAVTVSRSRRGEWGEWFEIWQMCHGKPVIIKQGWM